MLHGAGRRVHSALPAELLSHSYYIAQHGSLLGEWLMYTLRP